MSKSDFFPPLGTLCTGFFYCEIKWQNSGRGYTKLIGLLIQIIDKMDSISIDSLHKLTRLGEASL